MNYKKFIALILSCVLAAALLAGCAEKHVHNTPDTWQVNADSHWKLCSDCAETVDEGAHTLNEDSVCTVCTCEVYDFGDFISLSLYDAYENPLKLAEYSSDGKLITETLYEYAYDDNGNVVKSKVTMDGLLCEENEYVLMDGESMISKITSYNQDGSKFTNEYDENGNMIRLVNYDMDGNMESESAYEYTQLPDGEWYESKCTISEIDGSKTVGEYNPQGNNTSVTYYDTEGNVESTQTWEYVYGENDRKISEKHYIDGILTTYSLYKTVETEDYTINFPETVTEYKEDGSKTVTVYDENDQVVSQTSYDAEGNEI